MRSQPSNRRNERREPSKSAFDLLEQDHRDVEEWFDEYDELEDDRRKAELAEKICLALKVHTQIEEEIFSAKLARPPRITICSTKLLLNMPQ